MVLCLQLQFYKIFFSLELTYLHLTHQRTKEKQCVKILLTGCFDLSSLNPEVLANGLIFSLYFFKILFLTSVPVIAFWLDFCFQVV